MPWEILRLFPFFPIPFLVQRGLDFSATNAAGDAPLHVACSNGHYKTAASLLELGSAVNQLNKKGETPIHIAAQSGNIKLIKTLMKFSANPTIEAADGSTALDVAASAEIQALLRPSLERRSSKSQVRTPLSSSASSTSNSPRSLARRSMQVSFGELDMDSKDLRSSDSGSSNGSDGGVSDSTKTSGRSSELRRANSQPMNKKVVAVPSPTKSHQVASSVGAQADNSPPLGSSGGILSSSPGRARSRSFTSASNRLVLLEERFLKLDGGLTESTSTTNSNRGSSERAGSSQASVTLSPAEQQHMREKIEADLIPELEHILDPDFIVDVIHRVMIESKSFEWSRDLDTNKIEVLKWMCEFVAVEQKQQFLEHLYNFYPDKVDVEVIEEPVNHKKTYSSPKKSQRRKSDRRDGPSSSGHHRFTIRAKKIPRYEWEIDICEIEYEAEVGRGSYGTVFSGYYHGQHIAIKKLHSHVEEAEIPSFLKEIAILSRLNHPNILQFLGACLDNDLSLITEFCSLGDLRSYLMKRSPVDPFIKMSFALQVAEGLHYLHSQSPPIVHRDLKCTNILITEDLQVKLSDFGLSNTDNAKSTNRLGTLNWLAPEVLRGTAKYTTQADIYSIAMCIYEIAADGKSPYADMLPLQIVRAIDEGEKPPVPENCNPVFERIMTKCWSDEPGERLSLTQIIEELSAEKERLRPSFAPPQAGGSSSISQRRSSSPSRRGVSSPRRDRSPREPSSPRKRSSGASASQNSPRGARIVAPGPK
eukprot:TRINITY_DN781_c0_g1_i1.p1 TRINITY_DN781_c0_g1~~TRINITY_DN781_c0_g1_i1.p1  ORF type:complete len:761 (+),score=137.63 TRINITY_DN781_c0_g1_i1:383-2665(+)